jgi:6,7-dimethyl-8-ribityllumazine synthase
MDMIYKKGGMIMYVRDCNLFNKIKIYKLKEQGEFSFFNPEDNTDYSFCIRVLKEMGINHIELMSNNKTKINLLKGHFKVKFLEENNETNINLTPSKEQYFNISRELVYNKTVNIVSTIFNKNMVLKMLKTLYSKLEEYNVKIVLHEVPGIYEIPIACQKLTNGFNKSNIIIAVGVTNKSIESFNKSLMEIQLKNDTIIINGIISYSTEEQLENELNSTISEDLALSALHMIQEYVPSEIKKSIFGLDNSRKTFF